MNASVKKQIRKQSKITSQLEKANRFFEKANYQKAESLFAKVAMLTPEDMTTAYKYAICLRKNNKPREALNIHTKITAINPNSESYREMGGIYIALNYPDEAKKHLEQAISYNEQNHAAWSDMALFYHLQNKQEHALLIMGKALELAKQQSYEDITLYYHYTTLFFKSMSALKFDLKLKNLLLECIESDDVPHEDCNSPWLALLFTNPDFLPLLKDFAKCSSSESFATVVETPSASNFLKDKYFYTGVKKLNLLNSALEDICKNFRQYLLNSIVSNSFNTDFRETLFAFSEQCFFNEYLFSITKEEIHDIEKLNDELQANEFKTIANFSEKLAIIGCYKSLYKLGNAVEIESFAKNNFSKDLLFKELIKVQITEPLYEEKSKQYIKSLGTIQDQVSVKVQDQYEENPYPKWKSYAKIKGKEHGAFHVTSINAAKCKNMLIAGCGTGRQIAIKRIEFPEAKITAIDISKTSIAYAQRKCEEMGYNDIDFYHIDILDLESMNKTFDCISCTGVLHHMDDPMAGWKVLTNILEPGGYLNAAVYSEVARQHIVTARKLIADKGYASTPEGIRECREYIKNLPINHEMQRMTTSRDFYSISGTRDLIFHVNEHRYTVEDLRNTFKENNLNFIKLIFSDTNMHNNYKEMFPEDPFGSNFDNIEAFENKYPQSFFGMYQFWTQKPHK